MDQKIIFTKKVRFFDSGLLRILLTMLAFIMYGGVVFVILNFSGSGLFGLVFFFFKMGLYFSLPIFVIIVWQLVSIKTKFVLIKTILKRGNGRGNSSEEPIVLTFIIRSRCIESFEFGVIKICISNQHVTVEINNKSALCCKNMTTVFLQQMVHNKQLNIEYAVIYRIALTSNSNASAMKKLLNAKIHEANQIDGSMV